MTIKTRYTANRTWLALIGPKVLGPFPTFYAALIAVKFYVKAQSL